MYQTYKQILIIVVSSLILVSCGIYSFTGSSIPVGVETFQVNYFDNTAGGKPGSTIEPGLDRDFTIATLAPPTVMKVEESTKASEDDTEATDKESDSTEAPKDKAEETTTAEGNNEENKNK